MDWFMGDSFYKVFSSEMRPGLFTGFLTISGFLVSAHTFIVIHMKKEMYETEAYRNRMIKVRLTNPTHSYFGALRRLSLLLMVTVIVSLSTSLCQVTFGLHHANWSALVCVIFAGAAFVMLVTSVIAMAINLKSWFDELEESESKRAMAATSRP